MPWSCRPLLGPLALAALLAGCGSEGPGDLQDCQDGKCDESGDSSTCVVPTELEAVTGPYVDLERDILPRAVECELGNGQPDATLRAQAIILRSFAYWRLAREGTIGESWLVIDCGRTPSPAAVEAVADTAHIVLSWNDQPVLGLYVAGALQDSECLPTDEGDTLDTERFVTRQDVDPGVLQPALDYFELLVGPDADQETELAGYAIRGAAAQLAMICLGQLGQDEGAILATFFGDDIELVSDRSVCAASGE